jgi:hypothetical protein
MGSIRRDDLDPDAEYSRYTESQSALARIILVYRDAVASVILGPSYT